MTSPCSVSFSRPSSAPGREPEDRPARGPTAAADPAAPAVEQRQLDAVPPGGLRERGLGPVDEPVRGEIAGLLVRVGVAEHDLLPVAAATDVVAVGGVGEDRVEDAARGRERRRVLEERHDVERQSPVRVADSPPSAASSNTARTSSAPAVKLTM